MSERRIRKFLGFTVALVAATLLRAGFAQYSDPVKWSLHVSPGSASQNVFVAELVAKIEPGWHLYAMHQDADGPRPLRVTLPSANGFELRTIHAPVARVEHDANFDAPTHYYEDTAIFELQVVSRSAVAAHSLIAEVRYQACNAQMCLPPSTVQVPARQTSTLR